MGHPVYIIEQHPPFFSCCRGWRRARPWRRSARTGPSGPTRASSASSPATTTSSTRGSSGHDEDDALVLMLSADFGQDLPENERHYPAKDLRIWTRNYQRAEEEPITGRERERCSGFKTGKRDNIHACYFWGTTTYTMLTYNMSCLRNTNVALFWRAQEESFRQTERTKYETFY